MIIRLKSGSYSFEEMDDIVPLGTQTYLFEPEASLDLKFGMQSSLDSTNKDRLVIRRPYIKNYELASVHELILAITKRAIVILKKKRIRALLEHFFLFSRTYLFLYPKLIKDVPRSLIIYFKIMCV